MRTLAMMTVASSSCPAQAANIPDYTEEHYGAFQICSITGRAKTSSGAPVLTRVWQRLCCVHATAHWCCCGRQACFADGRAPTDRTGDATARDKECATPSVSSQLWRHHKPEAQSTAYSKQCKHPGQQRYAYSTHQTAGKGSPTPT
ncbi:hypothetical protein COO60DRAFT_1539233 [Scenedesmus sp. NREL 46B-D3]|nr:hypothetical protein COO60DRAFT_1539233 [Scenedesmus sp. NREL 46B-D3]